MVASKAAATKVNISGVNTATKATAAELTQMTIKQVHQKVQAKFLLYFIYI